MPPLPSVPPGVGLPTTEVVPKFKRRLDLICRQCGAKGTYRVGGIMVDPDWARNRPETAAPIEDAVSFTGLFRCKQCGAGGPWAFPPATHTQLNMAMLASLLHPEDPPIEFGVFLMTDGTQMHSAAEAEDYLKRKLQKRPDDAYLWGRLGNLYTNAGEFALARPAYEKSVQLDPGEVESNYRLGYDRMESGDAAGAAECFQRIARCARTSTCPDPILLEGMVRDSLSRLFDLHCDTDGAIPFPPEFDRPAGESPAVEASSIVAMEMDLGTKESWDILTSLCLTGRVPPDVLRCERNRAAAANGPRRNPPPTRQTNREPATVRGRRRVGRNDPCPCGSGRKYKRCCG